VDRINGTVEKVQKENQGIEDEDEDMEARGTTKNHVKYGK